MVWRAQLFADATIPAPQPLVAVQAGVDVGQYAQFLQPAQPPLRLRLVEDQFQFVADAVAADPLEQWQRVGDQPCAALVQVKS